MVNLEFIYVKNKYSSFMYCCFKLKSDIIMWNIFVFIIEGGNL